jgi:hypothetical protein
MEVGEVAAAPKRDRLVRGAADSLPPRYRSMAMLRQTVKSRIDPTFRMPPRLFEAFRRGGSIASREEATRPPSSRRQMVAPLGLVAGRGDDLGRGAVRDPVTHRPPETRLVPAGHVVTAMVPHGVGVVPPPRAVVPLCVQHHPRPRRMAPGSAPPRDHPRRGARALKASRRSTAAFGSAKIRAFWPRRARSPRLSGAGRSGG